MPITGPLCGLSVAPSRPFRRPGSDGLEGWALWAQGLQIFRVWGCAPQGVPPVRGPREAYRVSAIRAVVAEGPGEAEDDPSQCDDAWVGVKGLSRHDARSLKKNEACVRPKNASTDLKQ